MTARRSKELAHRVLEVLGISEAEERAYEYLLDRPSATTPEIAIALSLPPHKAKRLLDALEANGLVTHSPERPRRYVPAAPDIAMEWLVQKREEDLQGARAKIQELKERATANRHDEQEQMVELISSREAQRHVLEQLQLTARHEIVCLTRPPILVNRLVAPDKDSAITRHLRGLSQRCVVDPEFLELPGAIDKVRYDMENGEEARILPQLPLKLVLADRRIAFVPLSPQQPGSSVLLVRSSALVDALYALFEMLWRQAAPISFTPTGGFKAGASDIWPTKDVEDLLALLSAGLNDKTIAHELDLSLRTLKRRISVLMLRLKARTRFQLAWLAAPRFDGERKKRLGRR